MKLIKEPKHGDQFDFSETMYPSKLVVYGPTGVGQEVGERTGTSYGYVLSGYAEVSAPGILATLKEGSFFAIPGEWILTPDADGKVVVFYRYGHRAQLSMGGTEKQGRLSYIDGCSDSMLAYPARLGDPVLNYLHFPPGIKQSQHTHPSIRLGVVARGHGIAFGPNRIGRSDMWEHALSPGCIFALDAQEMHSFRTTESDEDMDIIAFHPDSDWGPSDTMHPMKNRTYINADSTKHEGA